MTEIALFTPLFPPSFFLEMDSVSHIESITRSLKSDMMLESLLRGLNPESGETVLPPFDSENMSSALYNIIHWMKNAEEVGTEDGEGNPQDPFMTCVFMTCADRELSGVLLYCNIRRRAVERLRWELCVSSLSPEVMGSSGYERLSAVEKAHYKRYAMLLGKYFEEIAKEEEEEEEEEVEGLDISVDLGIDLRHPPLPGRSGSKGDGIDDGLFMSVRGAGGQGEVSTTTGGTVSLSSNTVQWVRKDSTVTALLKQGKVSQFK